MGLKYKGDDQGTEAT